MSEQPPADFRRHRFLEQSIDLPADLNEVQTTAARASAATPWINRCDRPTPGASRGTSGRATIILNSKSAELRKGQRRGACPVGSLSRNDALDQPPRPINPVLPDTVVGIGPGAAAENVSAIASSGRVPRQSQSLSYGP